MRGLTTIELIIIIVVLVVTALFILSWLGLGSNPLDWFKKQSIKNTFCSEIVERTRCNIEEYNSIDDLGISYYDASTKIRKSEIGTGSPDEFATYGEVCGYFGYKGESNFKDCLVKLCGCKIK
ncbi:MAG: hypothetical protein QW197_01895 [Candidatus Aenigmatarchaeota archaeon]